MCIAAPSAPRKPLFYALDSPKFCRFLKNMTATADLSSPWVGASPPAVLRSHIHLEGFQIDGKRKTNLPLDGAT